MKPSTCSPKVGGSGNNKRGKQTSPSHPQQSFSSPRQVNNPNPQTLIFSVIFIWSRVFFGFHFNLSLSAAPRGRFWAGLFNCFSHRLEPEWLPMRKRTLALAVENDFHVDLTLHQFPASLLAEFEEKIVRLCFQRKPEPGRSGFAAESFGGAGFRFLPHNRNSRISGATTPEEIQQLGQTGMD